MPELWAIIGLVVGVLAVTGLSTITRIPAPILLLAAGFGASFIPGVPSFLDQFAFSLGTAAICALAAVFFHARNSQLEDERNLARWQQIAMAVAGDEQDL